MIALCNLRVAAALAGIGMVVLLPRLARAEPPWKRLAVFQRVEADAQNDYPVTEENGPWMILAVTFTSEGAQAQARELVYELRKRYKLPAYTHEMNFDFSQSMPSSRVNKFNEPVRMRYRRNRQVREIAVLVGDYPAVDDAAAQQVLQKLKYAQPECLKPVEGKTINRPLAALRMVQQEILASDNAKKTKGPMGHAFVTTNPLLPREYFVPSGVDRLVLEMNKEVEYGLLDCPGKYTVRVATFSGNSVIDPKELLAIEGGKDMPSHLAKAADSAHRLTMALRAEGVEAYEFHDRYSSMVTVGSFESVGNPRADGKIEINPQVHAIMLKYGANNGSQNAGKSPAAAPGAVTAKALEGIPFDPQPLPVEVPRRTISADYHRSAFRPH